MSFDKFEKLVNVLEVEPYQFFLFDKRDDDNADLAVEIAKLAGTLDKNKASLAYKIIFEISSAVEQEK